MMKPVCVIMDNARIHLNGVHDLFWSHHIYILKTIPYSPQTNGVEKVFAQVKAFMQEYFGNNYDFAEKTTDLLKMLVEKEYETKYYQLVSRYDIANNNYDEFPGEFENGTVHVNSREFNEKLEALMREKEEALERYVRREHQVSSNADEVDEELYKAMVMDAFGRVSVANTWHYLAFTMKVAHSCLHSYPLQMGKKFYKQYQINDDPELLALYIRYKSIE